MKVIVTGGTGFIGNYIVKQLLQQGVDVIVTGVNIKEATSRDWFTKVDFVELDINKPLTNEFKEKIASSDKLIHLIWSGLPNYKELHHFEINLMPQYFFIKEVIELGLVDITITGTCFEFGMQNGCLTADSFTDPQNPYALAKDTLRKFLQQIQQKIDFKLKWVRLFYMYGKGQSKKSILSQLEKSIENGDQTFNMSGGEQLRDYLPVDEVARKLIEISLQDEIDGLFNCCSGNPISIRKLVENYLAENNKKIELNLGYYPYADYEPMAFWGDNSNKQINK
jgi:nucleoside-diphosphate-sugar epimerase